MIYVSHTLDAWFRYLLATDLTMLAGLVELLIFNCMRSTCKFDINQSLQSATADVVLESVFYDRTDISLVFMYTWGAASAPYGCKFVSDSTVITIEIRLNYLDIVFIFDRSVLGPSIEGATQ